MSNAPKPAVSGTVVVVCIVVAFVFTLAAVVAVHFAVPEGGNPGSLAALLIGSFGALVPALVGLAKIRNVERTVDDLANGKMDAKIRNGVHNVLDEREGRNGDS